MEIKCLKRYKLVKLKADIGNCAEQQNANCNDNRIRKISKECALVEKRYPQAQLEKEMQSFQLKKIKR